VVYIKDKQDLSGLKGIPTNLSVGADNGPSPSDSRGDLTGLKDKIKEPSQYFSNLFNAYSRGVNIAVQRTGALFERPFKRIPVESESYLLRLIVYIHQNPQKHNFVNDFRDWNYSSYPELTGDIPTHLHRDKVIQLFGSRTDFIRIHQEIQPLDGFEDEE